MKDPLESIAGQVGKRREYESPPLHLWHPALNGDIPIRIDAQGTWFHEGGKIEREAMVRLFASILRREDDGEYYLITPVEKWRIQVEGHALLVTDIEVVDVAGVPMLEATLNTWKQIRISEQHPLFLDPKVGDIAVLRLPHGLTALFTRTAWYRLVELAKVDDGFAVLLSGDYEFRLPILQ
jgi:hypothetical protein